jgi:hypothetical protein
MKAESAKLVILRFMNLEVVTMIPEMQVISVSELLCPVAYRSSFCT